MESFTEINGHQIEIIKSNERNVYQESDKEISRSSTIEKPSNISQLTTPKILSINTQQTHTNISENGKNHRRNTVQPNLQPLLKKPMNSISTTKPLILPAPISDTGFTQGTKANIVTMQSNYSTSSVSSQFNNCQQQMAMGIATIQPQHFGYSGLQNNRYPMMPISLQNSYSTQQLTLANGSLGAAVQLMPVMNQNNTQLNSSRVQSLPLFMTPIIGAHSGMLFQPNMTIMPQSSNTMQTINIPPNSSYSNEYNPAIAMQSQPMYSTGIRNTTVFTTDFENVIKQDLETNKIATVSAQIVEKPELVVSTKINKMQTEMEPTTLVRTNVKHRELIRTQIYRMKPQVEEPLVIKIIPSPDPIVLEEFAPVPATPEIVEMSVNNESVIEAVKPIEIGNKIEKITETTSAINREPTPVVSDEVSGPDKPPPIEIDFCDDSDTRKTSSIESKPSTPISLPAKRKLPSPEILEENTTHPRKLSKCSSIPEKSDSGQKSPGSLFEKLYKDIPERKNSMFNQNNRQSNKLTAVVRPEQRKILVHYLDDLIVFESDEPFPTSNKMQVVKSALKSGNIKLNSQKSKMFTDHFLYTNTDDETQPNSQKKITRANSNSASSVVKPDSCLEPLSIDIPTTSSYGSVDSSQVRPLSVCSHQSPTPAPVFVKKTRRESNSPKKEVISPTKEIKPTKPPVQEPKPQIVPEIVENPTPVLASSIKDSIPVKQVSPVKQKPQKSGLDLPICEWSVSDVAEFVKQTPGCDNYVAMFQNHEIDGEALLLLSNDNLIQGALNMKIGPALKLCARIEKRKSLDPPQQ